MSIISIKDGEWEVQIGTPIDFITDTMMEMVHEDYEKIYNVDPTEIVVLAKKGEMK